MKHGDIGEKFHVYPFWHPSHYIDPLDMKEKPETVCSFISEWIADSDELEFVTSFLRPDDFVTEFVFKNKGTGKSFKVPVAPKQHLVWDQVAKCFKMGEFKVKPMPRINLDDILNMKFDILEGENR